MNIYTNLIFIAHFIFSHCLHYFNRQYQCVINDLNVNIRNDGVIQNYFGEHKMDERVKNKIYNNLAEVISLIRVNHDCEEQIQNFLINILDIKKETFLNIIRPNVTHRETKLLTWSNSIYEGCPMYLPKNVTLEYLNNVLEDNIPLTRDAKKTGFTK